MLPLLKSAACRRSLLRFRRFSAGAEAPSIPRSAPSPHVLRLVDDIASLSQTQISDLCRILIQKTGQEPPTIAVIGAGAGLKAGAAVAGGPAAGAKEEKKEEKTVFELKLEWFDAASKIKVIKEVRGFTDLGLKEAKELVEKAPVVIKGGFSKEEGEKIVEKMKAVGAKVVLE